MHVVSAALGLRSGFVSGPLYIFFPPSRSGLRDVMQLQNMRACRCVGVCSVPLPEKPQHSNVLHTLSWQSDSVLVIQEDVNHALGVLLKSFSTALLHCRCITIHRPSRVSARQALKQAIGVRSDRRLC